MIRQAALIAFLGTLTAAPALGLPVTPKDDAEVVEVLPATATSREERQWRRALAARPKDAAVAATAARRWLGNARELGDPRFAGQALAALEPWPDPATAPDDVLLLQATVEQYLHEFDAAAAKVERLVQRAPRNAQAWLTLATIRRVQGRYRESNAACRALAAINGPYAAACLAENEGLEGRFDAARSTLAQLVAAPGLAPETGAWLLTTKAELEARAGNAAAAEADYRSALRLHRDPYTVISYADFLQDRGRGDAVIVLLRDEPRSSDAVLLRLAIAGSLARTVQGSHDASEMRERIALANERPDVRVLHAREQAMFALRVDADAQRALELARINIRQQREPVDLSLLVAAARAAGDAAALREADQLRREVGVADRHPEASP